MKHAAVFHTFVLVDSCLLTKHSVFKAIVLVLIVLTKHSVLKAIVLVLIVGKISKSPKQVV